MDPLKNPYSPGAGAPPPELVGREPVIEQARILLGRVCQGRAEKSMLLTGLRGVGKTVLLNEIERIALEFDYSTIVVEAHEGKSLGDLLAPQFRKLLFELDRTARMNAAVKRGLAVLRAFIGSIKLTSGEYSIGLDIEPEKGTADSGDMELDLPDLFIVIGEAAKNCGTSIALLIDELQYFDEKELGALIMAMHKLQQKQLPFVLLGAGLPILPRLAGDSKSYAERLFNFPQIGALDREDAAKALQQPAADSGIAFTESALEEVFRLTHGYPYFVQEWGYQCWNSAQTSPIDTDIVETASAVVMPRLDQNFFRVRFDRLKPGEKKLLRAMAELGEGPYRMGDVAETMELKVTSLGPRRASLIKKGMIYSPNYGEIAFTVPMFDDFMRRAMPDLEG
ncbi:MULTISPECIES: ATP-binding protein [Pirellulaceae]|uniref:Archaeal ATPase n=2 Tax=Pirellulaceae TaxID=2691357 RepID=A0A5C6A0K9_9BACT|nr:MULTISPECIES: ATP-binding protein [Pirellulaceae]TWT92935.1 Archaeal ATPase [Neorhodopirellula pilleata]TWU09894.1 Archaeal ATPase [Allorhodopirellula heiligendammensis]